MGPIERKVKAAAAGSTLAGAVTELVLWLADGAVWGITVPERFDGLAVIVAGAVGAFVAGVWVKHTRRPDLASAQR